MEGTSWSPQPLRLRRLVLGLLICLYAVDIQPVNGDAVAVVALETHHGHMCRSFRNNDTLANEDYTFTTASTLTNTSTTETSNGNSMGLCLLARPERKQPHNPAYIVSLASANVTLAAGIDTSAFWVSLNEEKIELNDTLKPEAWSNFCMGISSDTPMKTTPENTPAEHEEGQASINYKVWASLQGRPLDLPFSRNISWLGILSSEKRVCLGTEEKEHASFTGMVTGITLLTDEELEEETQEEEGELGRKMESGTRITANCSLLVARNILSHPLDDPWTIQGPVLTLHYEELPKDPCLEPPMIVKLQGPSAYQSFLRLCWSIGGHLPTEQEVVDGMLEDYNCSAGEYLTWASGAEGLEGGPAALCPVLLPGGKMGQLECLRKLNCTLCMVPGGLTYTLFGPRKDFDRHYTLRALADGTFDFIGKETSSIRQGELGWTLSSTLHNDMLHQVSWVMGRRSWHSTYPNYSTNMQTYPVADKPMDTTVDLLTFTVCNAIQFSSDDGVCLLRSERCDGLTDSSSGSDEKDCGSQRTISKDRYYDKGRNPFFGQKQRGSIFYDFGIHFINKMTTEEGKARMEFNLFLDWEDSRLKFVDTKMGSNEFQCDDIWSPILNIFAGYQSGPLVKPSYNRSMCYIYWETKPTEEQQLEDPLMGRFYSKANVTQYLNLEVEFPCLLRVAMYPFGRYMCNLTISFFKDHENIKWRSYKPMEENYLEINYIGDKDLLDFDLDKVTAQEQGDDKLTVTLHLIGQPDYHMTNSFLPSSLMFVICYSSLFFPIAGFNERIMVSLTSLLVLVALFSQATDTYVKTPYYKLIDVWYVGLIFLCFAVVIANALVNYLRVLKVKSQTDLMKKVLAAKKCNIVCQIFLCTCFMSLVFVFVLFSNDNV